MSKLDGIKPGDRVRVTFEGEVQEDDPDSAINIRMDGADLETSWWAAHEEVNAPTFHIEKLAPPLKVGDRARVKGCKPLGHGKVLGVYEDRVWFLVDGRVPCTYAIADIEPAQ